MSIFKHERKIHNHQESYAFWYDEEGTTKTRNCLRCNNPFESQHKFNKLCDGCQDFADNHAGVKRSNPYKVLMDENKRHTR